MSKLTENLNTSAQLAETYKFSNEPIYFTPEHYDYLFEHCAKNDTSDITIQTNQEVFADIQGKLYRTTKRKITSQEVVDLCNYIYGPNASAIIASGKDIDTNHVIKRNNIILYRFRVNITACMVGGYTGIQVTMRIIQSKPPALDTMDLPKEILQSIEIPQGIIVVSGATGSGKSTLLSSIIADFAQRKDSNLKILTYESPIEYTYDEINTPSCIISQTEVPRYLPTFAAGIRNALRRKPGLILIGEARDQETIEAVITAALTGHPVYTTVHSNGVADVIRRMITIFPADEREARLFDLLETIKLLVWQALVINKNGTRTPIREYLVLSEEVRDQLTDLSPDDIVKNIRQLLPKYGQSAFMDAQNKYDQGIIEDSVLKRFKKLDEIKN